MEPRIRKIEYYCATVRNTPGEGYRVLAHLASAEVNLLAFEATPLGPVKARLALYPEDMERLVAAAQKLGLVLDGPHPALLVQGDDRLGALVTIHRKLYDAGVNVYGSTGVTDGKGTFGYILHIRPSEFERAARAIDAEG